MKKILSAWAALACIIATTSCSSDDTTNDVSIEQVKISSDDNNALRYPIEVTISNDAEVSITYWEDGYRENARTTGAVKSVDGVANLTIMFVKGNSDYRFCVNVNNTQHNQEYSFHTNTLPSGVPVYNVTVDNEGAPNDGYILQWQATKPGYVTFCDMQGNVVWYEEFDQAIRMAHFNQDERKLCVLTGFRDGVNSKNFQRLCDKIITLDLFGNRDVNWIASDDNVPYPHHDIKFTPDGNIIMVCNTIKEYDLTSFDISDTQVWGDGFTIISPQGVVQKTWNNFDELDPFNSNEIIKESGAPKDFLHANSVNWDSNGDYYMTMNRINQLWKIDGTTGKVLYRVGPNGNVTMDQDDYASGLHAAVPLAPNKVLCLDNGSDIAQSRAIIYEIDPIAMTARATLSVRIPSEYSSTDRSNVQLIKDSSMLMFGMTLGRANVFTDLNGNLLKVITRTGISYRSYYYEDITY